MLKLGIRKDVAVSVDKESMNKSEVRNSRVTKSSYKTELREMTSYFELLTGS